MCQIGDEGMGHRKRCNSNGSSV